MAPSKQEANSTGGGGDDNNATAGGSEQQQQQRLADGAGDLAQAYRDLARGEQAATTLERNLSSLEGKLDALLAAYDTRPDTAATGGDDSLEKGKQAAPERRGDA